MRRPGRARLWWLAPVAVALTLLAFPASAAAAGGATIVVDTTKDSNATTGCSLRQAIAAANTDQTVAGCVAGSSSGSDTIDVPAGTYDLNATFGQLLISSDLSIVGGGARSTDIRGYALGQRVFEISPGNVTISGVTIEGGNETGGSGTDNPGVGGGIWVDSTASLTLQDSTVSGNHADQSGGGIDANGSLTVVRSTIENNTAGCGVISCGLGIGGGIDDFGPSVTVTNSTIMGNQAQGDGGGLYLAGPSTLTNDTIANNVADISQATGIGGGGIAVSSGNAADLTNTLLAGNTWNGDGGNCSAAGIASLGGNLTDDGTCNLGLGDQHGVDPQLGGVDSSGPTDVLPLTSGSPAIDAGNILACPATDQRGVSRPQGAGCDIGAYEVVGGQLSGNVDQSVVKPVDLTAAGTSDWALWGYNSSAADQPPSALTPNETKANGGRQISDLSIVNGGTTPTRGFGSFADSLVPFSFDWTDGAPDAAVSGGHAGLTAPALGQGLSFTVPADSMPRTLTIWTSAHYADGTLTAVLSDGSAPEYTQTIQAFQFAPYPGENAPAIFTLRYAAASAGQHLTVTWTQSANNNCGGCEDVVLYAAALSKPALSNLSVSAAPSSAGAGIDRVPISTIPNAWLSFYAGSTNSSPVGSTPVGSTPVGSTPVGSTPVGSTPVGSTPVGSTPVGSTPVGSTPVGSTGLLDFPVGSTPVGSTALASLLLSQIPLCGDVRLPDTDPTRCQSDGATWAQVLAGTSLAGQPLNTLTLADVARNSQAKTRLAALPLKDVSFATSLFKSVHWSTLLLGGTPLDSVPPPQPYDSWCGGTDPAIPASGGSCANVDTSTTTLLQMDVADQLGSAPVGSTPVGSTPVGSTPVGSTPVGSTDVSASLLANIPLADITPLSPVVNCSGSFDCTGKTLGDAYEAGAILPTATFSDIKDAMAANGITINDLVVAILGAAGFPWEQLPIQGLQPYSATPSTVHYTVSTDVDCSVAPKFTLTARLPRGFFPVNGSAQVSVGNNAPSSAGPPEVLRQTAAALPSSDAFSLAAVAPTADAYRWTVDCPDGDTANETATLTFDSWVGLTLGTFTTDVAAAIPSASISTTGAPVTVHQNPEASDPSTATEVQPGTLVAGHIAFSGEQAFYKVKLDGLPRGTRIQAFLDVPSDADLDLTMSAPAAPSFFSTPVGSTPVGSTPIEDSSVGFSSGGLALPPDTLQDVPVGSTPVGSTPVGSTPVGSTSANRGGGVNEAGGIITAGQSGYVTIGVSGYNGSTSNEPFVLRVKETPPPPLPNCPARNLIVSSANQGSLPSSVPSSTKTLFIVDKQRLMAMYPSADVNSMLTALGTLAARSEVGGTILYVDGNAGVRNAYSAWDAAPCDTTARNNVVKAINDVVASYRNSSTGLPNLHYVVLVGSDEVTPMADAPDPVLLSPEENEAADLAFTTNGLTQGNALYASAAQNYILTDGAYGAFTNIPWLGRSLLLPQISVSRLVETPGDILGQINRYLGTGGVSAPQSAAGTLDPSSALVTGYDFLADGAKAVHDNLTANFAGLSTLDSFPSSGNLAINFPGTPNPPWSADDVLSNALQSNAPSIVSVDAHYNQYEFEAANGDLANTSKVGADLAARILFTMGCHGGLNVSDTLGGTGGKFLDWPELYAQKQAAMYIANTGYGYGDSASVALSERLLSLFAKNLHSDSGSVGEEWVNALQQYFATAGAYDVYDEKVMEETTFYGLPFWHFGTAGSGSTFTPLTPSAGPITGTQSTTITFPGAGATTQFQFGLYRPNLRITSQEVTSSLPARGAWIKDLTSTETPTTATIGYPTIDLAAHEPAPNVSPIFFPASPFTLEHSLAFGKERDYLNVSDQFRPTGSGDAGVQRHFTGGTFEIFYSQSTDRVAPLISQVNVSTSAGIATVTARVTDDSGVAEAAALVNDGSWHYLQLTQSPDDPTLWTGTIPVSVDPEVFVEATDGVNVSYSANKGLNFTSTNSNSPPDGVQITILAPVGPYTLNDPVTPTFHCGPAAAQCVGTPLTSSGQIDTSTPGLHTFVVQALDAQGNVLASLERQYAVDYGFNGFFQPVNNLPTLNFAKAGTAIPVKFSLGGNQGLNIFYDSTYPASRQISCDASAPVDTIETTVAAGQSSLSYDATSDQYTYVWKTSSSWSGTCRALVLRTKFGTYHTADFKFK
jgi:hypothetical protein